MGRWEWIILLLGFLALLVWELRNTRRDIRDAKNHAAGRVKPATTQDRNPPA